MISFIENKKNVPRGVFFLHMSIFFCNFAPKLARKRFKPGIIIKILYKMNLSELTDKIYAEGVEKGNAEAQQIVEKANAKAAGIIAEAEKKAAAIVAAAENKSADLDKKTRAELKLYAEQSVNAVKTEIVNLLSDKIASDSVKAATADPKFMQSIIAKLAEQMAKDGEVIIEAKDAEALKKYFASNVKGILDHSAHITEVKGIKTDFTIQPAKGGYKLAFGDAEFIAYFKEMLRPQLVEELF